MHRPSNDSSRLARVALGATVLLGVVAPAWGAAKTSAAKTSAAKPTSPVKTTRASETTSVAKSTGPAGSGAKAAVKKGGLWQPNATEPPNVVAPFDWTAPAPASLTAAKSFEDAIARSVKSSGLFTLLIIGSDARPNEKPDKTRGDSIHLLVWNPAKNAGTIVGFPRDLWVSSGVPTPGRINGALTSGGPARMLAAVNGLGGPKVSAYVLTGFAGFEAMVNEIGGVHVRIDQTMNEPLSGAQFAPGWFAMNGGASLAYVRNRKNGVPGGDLGRSANQGQYLLWTLAKLRRETSTPTDLARWITTFRKNALTNIAVGDMLVLAQLARGIDQSQIRVVVLPVKPVTRGGAAVLDLDKAKAAPLLADIAGDGVIGAA